METLRGELDPSNGEIFSGESLHNAAKGKKSALRNHVFRRKKAGKKNFFEKKARFLVEHSHNQSQTLCEIDNLIVRRADERIEK
jgi:hypothetical protein